MPVEFKENKAAFTDTVTIEEAESLFEWLLDVSKPEIEMTDCNHIHTSVLQLIAIFKPKIKLPEDEEFKIWFSV